MGCNSSKTVAAAPERKQKAAAVATSTHSAVKSTLLSIPASEEKMEKVAGDWEWKSEAERIFKLADVDGNNCIDMAELAGVRNSELLAQVMMGVNDTDVDGKLSLSEWLAYIKSVHDKKPAACKALLKLYEKQIAAWEWKSEAERIFKLADKNGNGYIDMAELAAVRNSEHLAQVMMGEHDMDLDGRLSLSEWFEYIKIIHDTKPAACKTLLKLYERQISSIVG